MKKIFVMAALAASTLAANAQQQVGSLQVTPRMGVGYTFAKFDFGGSDFEGAVTASLGAELRYQLAEKVGVSAGLDYSYMKTGEIDECKVTASLVNVPVLLHYDLTSKLGVFAGAQFNFLSEVKGESPKADLKMTSDCEKTTVSFPVGLQYDFEDSWTISAYYNIATQPVAKKEKLGVKDDVKFANVMVTFGYRFGL